jgi:hypothetical protein
MDITGHQKSDRLYETQFSDFRLDVHIRPDWMDVSYRNDICQSFRKAFPSSRSVRI